MPIADLIAIKTDGGWMLHAPTDAGKEHVIEYDLPVHDYNLDGENVSDWFDRAERQGVVCAWSVGRTE
jgi:hypothetical protein